MRRILPIALWIAMPFLAFAQLDDDTLTVTASRTVKLQPDQIVVGVTVSAPSDAALDDVVSALSGTGIAAANLSSAYTSLLQVLPQPATQWTFTLPVSFARFNGVLSALAKIQQTLRPNSSGMNLTYFVQSTQVSPELQAANPCAYTSLMGDAQRQAQNLAAAAGVKVGAVVALSDGFSGAPYPGAIVPANRNGDFSAILGGAIAIYDPLIGNPFFVNTAAPACSMTVQFKLLR